MAALSLCLLLDPAFYGLIQRPALMEVKYFTRRGPPDDFPQVTETSNPRAGGREFHQMSKCRRRQP